MGNQAIQHGKTAAQYPIPACVGQPGRLREWLAGIPGAAEQDLRQPGT